MGSRLLQGVTSKLNYNQHWNSLLQPFLMEDAHPLIIRPQSTELRGLMVSACALYLEVLGSNVSRILAILMAFFVVLSLPPGRCQDKPQIKIRPSPLKGPGLCCCYSDEARGGWSGVCISTAARCFSLLHIVQTGFAAHSVFAGKASGAWCWPLTSV
jgi:hypothetical protein